VLCRKRILQRSERKRRMKTKEKRKKRGIPEVGRKDKARKDS
jgi:hypothetical protein